MVDEYDPYKAMTDREALTAIAAYSNDEFSVKVAEARLKKPAPEDETRQIILRVEEKLDKLIQYLGDQHAGTD